MIVFEHPILCNEPLQRSVTTNNNNKWSVSWSLTSPFSTNMALSETKGQGWRAIPTQWRKASDILTSTLAAFLIRILTKGPNTGSIFHRGQCYVTTTSREHCSQLSCHYWGLHNPFCCILRSRDSQCFSIGPILHKIAFQWRDLDPI